MERLPDTVDKAESVDSFKGRLDRFWNGGEVKFNQNADIKGTGSRSNLSSVQCLALATDSVFVLANFSRCPMSDVRCPASGRGHH